MNWWLVPLFAIPLALVIDLRWGEPAVRWHPVVWMGRYLDALGPQMRTWPPLTAFVGGMLAWAMGACCVVAVGLAAEMLLQAFVIWFDVGSPWGGVGQVAVLAVLLKPLLSWRMLRDEVAAVEQALTVSLPAGQAQLQRLVSRDVTALDEITVRESAIETLAENLNDSVIAPVFWFAVGGLPAAALYRFANTADAMWGYRGQYEWVGKWSAWADDVLSWVPARITALLLVFVSGRRLAWSTLRRQASQTPSPNGGWPMGAMALLLDIQLRKPGVYVLHAQGALAQPCHARQAIDWAGRAVWAGACLGGLFSWACSQLGGV